MFKGSICALITPFRNGAVDKEAFARLVERQIEHGTHGLVPCGTTGESPTLSHDEHDELVELCVKVAAGRVPVMAGTGSNSTAEAIRLTQHAQEAGADGALIVAPYYNKPNQEGLYQHFKAIHDATDIPIFLYNIPGRCVIDIGVETMARLARLPRVVGVKDATANILRVSEERAAIGEDFIQLSGEDATVLAYLMEGGRGCVSVSANVAPALCSRFQTACLGGDFESARQLHRRLLPLHRALFVDPSPAGAKYALSKLGLCADELRLPLVPAGETARARLDEALRGLGDLS